MQRQGAKYIPEQQRIESIEPLPIDNRKRTDFCCTIVNSAFVLLLFIILLFMFKLENLQKITYPNDSDGKMCGYDDAKYPYLYFTSPSDVTKRLCVSKCPIASDQILSCKPTNGLSCSKNSNPKYEVQIYESYLDQARIGLICVPQDQAVKNSIFEKSGILSKYQFLGFYDAIWRSIWISIIFALLYTLFAFFQPYIAVPWTIGVGGVLSIVFGLIILIKADGYWFVKILLFAFMVILGVYSFITIFNASRRQSIYICSRIMHSAALISYDKKETDLPRFSLAAFGKLLKPLAIITVFIFLFGVFLVMIAFEILSAWSSATITFDPNYPFYSVTGFGSSFLTLLILLQFIWGMSFLKEAFNFIVSSYAAHKYYSNGTQSEGPMSKRQPGFLLSTEILLRYHWGSVAGGSLLLGFFYFSDLFLGFFLPEHQKLYQKNLDENQRTGIGEERQYNQSVSCCEAFFNLIREESFAYIFLTGVPYCNASRYCEMLSGESQFYNYSQSTNRLFRLNMHIIPIVLTVLIAIGSMQSTGSSSPYGIFCITMITFFVITFFVSYIGDVAEGLLIATYVQLGMNDESCLELAPEIIKLAYKQDLQDYYRYEMDARGQPTTVKPWYKIFTQPTLV